MADKLQIIPYLEDIISLIKTTHVVSVIAPTGSGKSLGIPIRIAQEGARCFVSVPTRTAAISLASYQRKILAQVMPQEDPNIRVGYAAEGDIKYTSDALIVYATSGHIRKKLLSYFTKDGNLPIDFCTVLLVDEVHSGSLDNTVILALWMAGVDLVRPRLILASATPIPLAIEPVPEVYTVDLSRFPIKIEYGSRDYEDDPAIYRATAERVMTIHNSKPITDGHILVFAPGSAEVESVITALKGLKGANVIPAYGAMQSEAIDRIYEETRNRKIIVATNIAETSITIENIGFVVDTLLEKRSETSESGGLRLVIHMISKDSATQRAGRTGRTRSGICYRMCTEARFNKLEDHRPPEIERIPLYETVMELMASGLKPEILLSEAGSLRITSAQTLLQSLHMIDGDQVTELGHFAPQFPLSVRNASFLYNWINYAGLRFRPKIITAGAQLYNLNLNLFEIDHTSEFSSITPFQMVKVDEIFIQEKIAPTSIIDATANVGGDSMNFMRLFPEAYLTSIEVDPKIAHILRRNMANLPGILNTNFVYKTRTLNISALDYFKRDYSADLIYFDPPWGGRDYHLQEKIVLELAGQSLGVLLGDILVRGLTPLIIVKAPSNVDSERLLNDIQIPTTVSTQHVMNGDKIVYSLLFIRPVEPRDPISSSKEVIPEVPLTAPPSYPVFPGLVIASIIDSYGQSYYWLPRKPANQRIEDFNVILEQHIQRYYAKYLGYNDLDTCLNMWHDLMIQINGNLNGDTTQWARRNNINNKKIRELLKIIQKSSHTLQTLGYHVNWESFTTEDAGRDSRPLLYSAYSDNILFKGHAPGLYLNPNIKERVSYRISNKSVNTLSRNYPPGLIAIWITEINPHLKLVSFSVDTDVKPQKTREPRVIKHIEVDKPDRKASQEESLDESIFEAWLHNEDDPSVAFSEYVNINSADLTNLFKKNAVIFPLIRRTLLLNVIVKQFEALNTTSDIDTTPYNIEGAPRSTYQAPGTIFESHLMIQNISPFELDYFTELVRIQQGDHFTNWYRYDSYLQKALTGLKNGKQDLTIPNLRKELGLISDTIETSFITSVLKVLNLSNPNIFDTDIGFGSHLVASLVLKARSYTGLNPHNYPLAGYYEIINKLGADPSEKLIHQRYRVGNVEALNGAYDIGLVFDPDSEDRNHYLTYIFPNIIKAWEAIRPGGYLMVKAIGTIPFLSAFPNAWYCGPIVYNQDHMVWIWCKFPYEGLTDEQKVTYQTIQESGRTMVAKLYPEVQ